MSDIVEKPSATAALIAERIGALQADIAAHRQAAVDSWNRAMAAQPGAQVTLEPLGSSDAARKYTELVRG